MNTTFKKILISLTLLIAAAGFYFVYLSRRAPLKPLHPLEGDYSYTIEHADFHIRRMMDQANLPGLAVTLVAGQQTVWQQTFGSANLEEGIEVQADTVFQLYSLAKVFTALEIMRMAEDGLVDLDQPITELLPDFSVQQRFPESAPITVRSLLTHHSGLPRNGCHRVDFGPEALTQLAASLADCPTAFPPGERYKYSNIAFNVLGSLIEQLRAASFADTMQAHWFQPMGMEHSSFMEAQLPARVELAAGYEYFEGEYSPLPQKDIATLASGNLYSTIEDMGRFLKMLFNEGRAGEEALIGANTLATMMADQPVMPLDAQTTGLGWKTGTVLNGEHLVWHDGGPGEGIGGLIAFLPEHKLGLVLIANATGFETSLSLGLAIDVLENMLAAQTGEYLRAETAPPNDSSDELPAAQITGRYAAFGDILEVTASGEKLQLRYQGFGLRLRRVGANTYQPGHWLFDLGLGPLLGMPYDLSRLRLVFVSDPASRETVMLLRFSGAAGETSLKVPVADPFSELMEEIAGDYALLVRHAPGFVADPIIGYSNITYANGILLISGPIGPIAPISPTELVILSGPFAGEVMVYEPEHAAILHQMIVYFRP